MRKITCFWVFICIQTLGFSASARGLITLADSVNFRTIANLVYGNAPDHRNELDIYLPKKHGPKTPMVVFIHGGFWSKGGKHQLPKPLIDLLVGQKDMPWLPSIIVLSKPEQINTRLKWTM